MTKEYEDVQRILLKWNGGRRPFSGQVNELIDYFQATEVSHDTSGSANASPKSKLAQRADTKEEAE